MVSQENKRTSYVVRLPDVNLAIDEYNHIRGDVGKSVAMSPAQAVAHYVARRLQEEGIYSRKKVALILHEMREEKGELEQFARAVDSSASQTGNSSTEYTPASNVGSQQGRLF